MREGISLINEVGHHSSSDFHLAENSRELMTVMTILRTKTVTITTTLMMIVNKDDDDDDDGDDDIVDDDDDVDDDKY